MLKKCLSIAEINRWNNCFQNIWHAIGKNCSVGRENLFCQKKTPKIMGKFLDRVTLEGAGGQTDDTRSTFRVPLKNFDPVLFTRSWLSATKCGPLAKIWGVKKIPIPQFLKLSLTTQITSSHSLWEEVICVVRLNFKDFGSGIFLNTVNASFLKIG